MKERRIALSYTPHFLLEAGNLPIESVAEQVGFFSAVTYRQQFKARFGVSPVEWRKTFRTGGIDISER